MAKGMDVGTMALIGGGGYLALAYTKGMWPFNATAATSTPTTPNYVAPAPKPAVTTQKPVDNTTPATSPASPAAGATSVVNGATYQWNGSAWVLLKAAPVVQPCPTGYVRANNWDPNAACVNPNAPLPTFCETNTPGWSIQNGECRQTPVPPSPVLISQKMVAAAGTSSGLGMDQWCFYYQQVTGNDCPVDPGSIDMTPYGGGDRSTPISIGTWLSIMQDQAPQLGLSGLGDLSLSSIPTWGWLAAAGVALMFMGGR